MAEFWSGLGNLLKTYRSSLLEGAVVCPLLWDTVEPQGCPGGMTAGQVGVEH